MKIEKLTEDKIRIILNIEDLEINNVNLKSLLTNSDESQKLLSKILLAAEKEIGFNTSDCKLLIEAIASPDEEFIFTITKFYPEKLQTMPLRKHLNVKRKVQNLDNNSIIYSFTSFDSFCDFAVFINKNSRINLKSIAKSISLYLYKNTYYLIVSNFDNNSNDLKLFTSEISEFTNQIHLSNNFEAKVLEYGKVIFKKNALQKCCNFFE